MNSLDYSIITSLNVLARKSLLFDGLTVNIVQNYFLKGGVIMALFWWAWFAGEAKGISPALSKAMGDKEQRGKKKAMGRGEENKPGVSLKSSGMVNPSIAGAEARVKLVAAAVGSILSLFAARLLAMALPFRPRPVVHPDLTEMQWPYLVTMENFGRLDNWSSFPSDHAALFFALAFGLLFVSPMMGIFACIYVSLVICMPRIYAGFHYPTDILAGILIAGIFAYVLQLKPVRNDVTGPFIRWLEGHSASFYAGAFLFCFLIGTLFDDVRNMGTLIWSILK